MNAPSTTTTVNPKRKRKINLKVIILFLILAIGCYIGYRYINTKNKAQNQVQQRTGVVRRGDITVSISGSGTLSSASTFTALSSVEGTISKIYCKDGDKIQAGSLVMELDSGEALLDIKKLENNISKAKISRDQLLKSMENNQVIAPISGEITEIRYKSSDDITKGTSLLTITDKSQLKLLLPFRNSYRNELEQGQKATIYVFDSAMDEVHNLEGTISFISSAPESAGEAQSYNIEFIIDNPGYLDNTMIASAEITVSGKTIKSIGNSNLSYIESATAKAEIAGTIEGLDVLLGQYVKKGDVLATIINDDLSIELETSNLNIEEMENQLEYLYEKLSHYKIYSDIDGTLSLEDLKVGDAVKAGTTVFKVSNYDLMEFQIAIDELDISKIQTGQNVYVTVDALEETEEKPLTGVVTEIAQEGNITGNGVTTYPVTILLTEANNQLKVGMNVNGEIIVNEKKDVLYVPIEAVQKQGGKNIVYVKTSEIVGKTQEGKKDTTNPDEQKAPERRTSPEGQKPNADQNTNMKQPSGNNSNRERRNRAQVNNYYAGTVPKTVEIGINNDQYIEIVNGLNEGDIIILPQLSSTSNTSNNQTRGGFGGGMTGGMPGGGTPGGMPFRTQSGTGR
ncbi:HlyD family efflux transporter periplasmic adaptor subunit [Lutispora thermophila]|uniref:HlyD family secretion protein n=1 Tax=Lutispora thermophila DSM 19022 TaxID=1122184 RepID=A0A1M6C0P1_9FIRM|nr:HlyD family efflux transporter periplasmic adaptor subunit [Lutispora thermophila]SHI54304.1 HlyD family secretion protein [Lutispora thermophila DSM 19022]